MFFRPNPLPRLGSSARGEVNPKTPANPQPTRVGKTGVQGAEPPGGGTWGVSPHTSKQGASSPLLHTRHGWDPKRWRTLSLRGWGKRGSRGQSPLAGGRGGCPPTKPKLGANSLLLPAPPRVEAKNPANPKLTRVGKRGVQGVCPLAGGCGGCPPTLQNKGQVAHSYIPATGGTPKLWRTLSLRGWGKFFTPFTLRPRP